MALIRWRPADRFPRIWDEFDKLFEEFLPTFGEDRVVYPAIDLYEEDDKYIVKADLPGVTEKDVELTLHDNVLTIKGQKETHKEEKKKNYYRSERIYGEFSRSITIPGKIDSDKIAAEFKDGVLSIVLPKKEESKTKKIEIKKK